MNHGPKRVSNTSPLPFSYRGKRSNALAAFAKQYLIVQHGKGAGKPLVLQKWQKELLGSVYDAKVQPRIAGWTLPRGSGKSTLICVPALYELFCGEMGASIVVVAHNEKQAKIVFNYAKRFIELNPELSSRCRVYEERLEVPARGSSFVFLSSTPDALQGLNPSLGIVDEYGHTPPEVFDAVALAAGKRARSTTLGIGTPSNNPESKLEQLRESAFLNPTDTTLVYREHSAAGFEDHPVDCQHCWSLANPAMGPGGFLYSDALTALLPPKMDEYEFRRVRLCQHVRGGGQQFLDGAVWDKCSEPARTIPDGARVVLGLDGSRSNDATAVVAVSVEDRPIVQPVGIWSPDSKDTNARVPILQVEEAIRQACQRWNVVEIACDFYLWERTAQVLEDEGLPVVKFPQGHERMVPSTAAFREAVHQGELSHVGDSTLTAHVLNAVTKEVPRGVVVRKVNPNSALKIDALVGSLMAFTRAKWHYINAPKRNTLRVLKMR